MSPQARAAAEVRRREWEARQRVEAAVIVRDPAESLLAASEEADAIMQLLRARLDAGEWDGATVVALGEAVERCGRIAKAALDARVDERRLVLSEARGNHWAEVIQLILRGLNLTPAQWELADEVVKSAARAVLARQPGRLALGRSS